MTVDLQCVNCGCEIQKPAENGELLCRICYLIYNFESDPE
jgi:hypothetical protein